MGCAPCLCSQPDALETESLTHLLNLCPEISAFHEPEPVLWDESREAFHSVFDKPERQGRIFLRARRSPLQTAFRANRFYAETSNRMTYFAPAIAQVLENSQFLHLYRHPADVVRSGMRRGWYQNHSLDKLPYHTSRDTIRCHGMGQLGSVFPRLLVLVRD